MNEKPATRRSITQGSIIKFDLDPVKGHEQAGYRPALVMSNETYNKKTPFLIVCPITNTKRGYPLHVELDERTKTTGVILCDQPRVIDRSARKPRFVENIPSDILDQCVEIVSACIARS
jgi:mRNA interferase MazF